MFETIEFKSQITKTMDLAAPKFGVKGEAITIEMLFYPSHNW
jgi:hypothetical protein